MLNPTRLPLPNLTCVGLLTLLAVGALTVRDASAAVQIDLPDGIFFEAEDYDEVLRGEGFAIKTNEPAASGQTVLTGVFRPGAARYDIVAPAEGPYTLWLRLMSPGNARVKLGVNTADEERFETFQLEASKTQRQGKKTVQEYGWQRLGPVQLHQGRNQIVLGQGAIRPDCFYLARQADQTPGPALFAAVERAREQPRGEPLPELVHERRIARRPAWLQDALRPCYAHFEWDPTVTAESWCQRAKQSGANCIFGAGEMPAGTLDGRLKAFSYGELSRDPPFQFPKNYRLDYAWTKQFVDAAHAEGLKMVLYDGAFRSLDPILVAHPEWRQTDASGKPYGSGFGSWHSPYRQAYIRRWVDVARLSKLDGIMIDMMFTGPVGGDFSEYTVKAFQDRFGVEPPRKADPRNLVWQRWIDFQAWSREEAALELTEALHAVDPEIAVIVNQTVGWIFRRVEGNFLTTRAAQCVDGLLEEMGWDYRHRWQRPWAWPASAAWQNLFLHCRTRPGYGQMWHVSLNFPEAHVQSLAFAMLANGTAPGVVTAGNWPDMTRIWEHIRGCEAWCEQADLVPWMALHFGEDTLRWYANSRDDATYDAWMKNLFGVFQAALELHLPIEIITDDDLADPARLARYAVVVLPNSACMSQGQGKAVEAFVRNGGGLVATFETGCYDENGTRRDRPLLSDLFGAVRQQAVQSDSWNMPLVEPPPHPILDHPDIRRSGIWSQGQAEPKSTAMLYAGPHDRSIGAVPLSELASGATTVPLSGVKPQPSLAQAKPGVMKTLVAQDVGPGRSAFFPIDLGHAYYVFNHPLDRRLLGQSIQWAAHRPAPLTTTAPMLVQTVLYAKGPARVVHLLNDISSFGRAAAPNPEAFTAFRDEVVPIHDIRVSLAGAFSKAVLLPEGRSLTVTQTDGSSTVVIPRLEIHAMVVFTP